MSFELSVNHYICGDDLAFPDFAAAVAAAGIAAVGITRAAVAEMGLAGLERCLADHGLAVSSLNSAGYFTGHDPSPVRMSDEEMIDAAARLKAAVLCVISGGLGIPALATEDAHGRVRDGFGRLAERAAAAGVVLGLEPVYPGDIFTKGCINSCAHGLEIVAPHDNAKLIVDLYHSWWDNGLQKTLHDRPDAMALIQLSNIRVENGMVRGREALADGALDLSRLLPPLLSRGYAGRLELELFARDLRGRDPLDIIRRFPAELNRLIIDTDFA